MSKAATLTKRIRKSFSILDSKGLYLFNKISFVDEILFLSPLITPPAAHAGANIYIPCRLDPITVSDQRPLPSSEPPSLVPLPPFPYPLAVPVAFMNESTITARHHHPSHSQGRSKPLSDYRQQPAIQPNFKFQILSIP